MTDSKLSGKSGDGTCATNARALAEPHPSLSERRERIARIIDPEAFRDPSHPSQVDAMFRPVARHNAFAKADAILSEVQEVDQETDVQKETPLAMRDQG